MSRVIRGLCLFVFFDLSVSFFVRVNSVCLSEGRIFSLSPRGVHKQKGW